MTFRLHRKDSSIQGIPLIGLSSQVSSARHFTPRSRHGFLRSSDRGSTRRQICSLLFGPRSRECKCSPWQYTTYGSHVQCDSCLRAVQESLSSPIDRRSDYYRQRAREQQPQSQAAASAKPQPLLTAPNVLTFLRLLMVPVLVVLWFLPHRLAPLASASTFIFAAITDWADGYLARRVRSLTNAPSYRRLLPSTVSWEMLTSQSRGGAIL